MSKEKLAIGIIGIGRWGKNILRTILDLDDVNLTCITTKIRIIILLYQETAKYTLTGER